MKYRIATDTFFLCIIGLLWCAFFSLGPSLAYAQSQGLGGEVRIETDPRYPNPGQTFTARLADYSHSLGSGDLTWYINGVPVEESKNKDAVSATAPSLGTPLVIKATRASIAGPQSISLTVVPSEVDIITESDTSAPYFYKGRRTPGLGTSVRLVAIPHIYDAKGIEIAPANLAYTWNIDNTTIENSGSAILETTLSNLGDTLVLLSVESRDHATKYEMTFFIENADPTPTFYVYNPLTGLSSNAIQDAYLPAKDEVTVRAQPYGMSSTVYRNGQYTWSVNGETVQNTNTDPQMITLRKSGNGGASDIGFSLRNLSALSQYVQSLFRIDFK